MSGPGSGPRRRPSSSAPLESWRQLVDAQRRNPQLRNNLANTHHSIGSIHRRAGRIAKAKAAYQSALTIQEALAREYPGVPVVRCWLANTYRSLGNVELDAALLDNAEAAYRRALTLLEELNREFPRVTEYLGDLANTRLDLVRLYAGTGRRGEAESALRSALEIREALPVTSPEDLYTEARAHARFDATFGREPAGARPGVPDGRGDHADRAMAALRRALDAGFSDAAQLRADHDLDSLRSRPDFRALLMDLDLPADPFAR